MNKIKDIEQLTIEREKAAQEALAQIDQQKYAAFMQQHGCQKLLNIGIAFSGKQFVLKWKTTQHG